MRDEFDSKSDCKKEKTKQANPIEAFIRMICTLLYNHRTAGADMEAIPTPFGGQTS